MIMSITPIDFARMKSATSEEERAAILAETSFSVVEKPLAVVIQKCAVLHWFNNEIVLAYSEYDSFRAESTIAKMVSMPFIEKLPNNRYAFHQLTRRGLLNQYAVSQPELMIDSCIKALPVLAKMMESETEKFSSQLETFFCLVVAGYTDDATRFFENLESAFRSVKDWSSWGALLDIRKECEHWRFVQPIVPTLLLSWRERGEAMFAEARNISPESASPLILLQSALSDLTNAILQDPNIPSLYYLRGEINEALDNIDRALEDYNRAVALDSQNADFYAARGVLYERRYWLTDNSTNWQERTSDQQAIDDYQRAVEFNRDDIVNYYNLIMFLIQLDRIEEAQFYFHEMSTKFPDRRDTYECGRELSRQRDEHHSTE